MWPISCPRAFRYSIPGSLLLRIFSKNLATRVGIAIESARLYNSLQRKVDEYERLKDFSENIVESINVGIWTTGWRVGTGRLSG